MVHDTAVSFGLVVSHISCGIQQIITCKVLVLLYVKCWGTK
jgi:hypothetical protein